MAHDGELTAESFDREVIGSDVPFLVDFWTAWCGPCLALDATLREVAPQLDGTVRIGRLNIAEHPDIAARYAVKSVPTMLLFRGGDVVKRMLGAKSAPLLLAELRQYTS